MSFPVFVQARDSINKAYIALQNWNSNPADVPIPDVVNTKRPHLTDGQIAERYLQSITGNPNIDINRVPKMTSRDRIEHELPIVDVNVEPAIAKRKIDFDISINRTRCSPDDYDPDIRGCDDELFHAAKADVEFDTPLLFELKGSGEPDCTCLTDVPRFIVCSTQNFGYVHEKRRYIIGEHILDYRNVSQLYGEPSGKCSPRWNWLFDCPTPATKPEEINRQIDDALNKSTTATIFLNQTLLSAYLSHRKANGELDNFTYALVSDDPRENTGPAKPNMAAIISAAVAAAGLTVLGVVGAIRWRLRTSANSTASTTTATQFLPLPTNSARSARSTTTAVQFVATQPAAPALSATNFSASNTSAQTNAATTAAKSTKNSSSYKSDDAVSASIYIAPAGFED